MARRLLEEAVPIGAATLGPAHHQVGPFIHTLGKMHLAAGDWGAAETRLREAVDVYEASRNQTYVGLALTQAAGAVAAQGRTEEALSLLERAASLGPLNPELLAHESFAALRQHARFAELAGS